MTAITLFKVIFKVTDFDSNRKDAHATSYVWIAQYYSVTYYLAPFPRYGELLIKCSVSLRGSLQLFNVLVGVAPYIQDGLPQQDICLSWPTWYATLRAISTLQSFVLNLWPWRLTFWLLKLIVVAWNLIIHQVWSSRNCRWNASATNTTYVYMLTWFWPFSSTQLHYAIGLLCLGSHCH